MAACASDPTPEEIAATAAAIRQGWDAATWLYRMGFHEPGPAKPNGYAAEPARGTVSTRPPTRRSW